jgi:ribosome-binding factor A
MRSVIKDPRINTFISITDVKVSKDLAYADIFISSVEGQKKIEKAVDALNHASGFIQHKLRRALRMRTTPVLRFQADRGIELGFELSKKIDTLTDDSPTDREEKQQNQPDPIASSDDE